MTERPVLMHARSINGILENHKCQTRRIMRPQPSSLAEAVRDVPRENKWYSCSVHEDDFGRCYTPLNELYQQQWKSPYGIIGDRLWVREAWRARLDEDHIKPRDLRPRQPWYCATGNGHGDEEPSGCGGGLGKKRPGIHMPRWASRITLEITDVRVQRIRDISHDDCLAEGIQVDELNHAIRPDDTIAWGSAQGAFAELWEMTNGDGAWKRNDWVWAVSFRWIRT